MKKKFVKICTAISLTLAISLPILFGTGAIVVEASGFVPNNQGKLTLPVAAGTDVRQNAVSEIDFSHARYGYIMARWQGPATADVFLRIDGPDGIIYQYGLNPNGRWEVFPLTCGNGAYVIRILERVEGNRATVANSINLTVTLVDEFAPFLRPNQFVNFNADSRLVPLSTDLTARASGPLESVAIVYNWVVNNIEYDFELAETVQSGYVPDLDHVLYVRRGICFDYASLMTAMLRSQGIPTRLVIGFVGDVRHAWISVFTEETGWINDIIRFDGREWRLMDPTFSSTGGEAARRFVGDGQNHRPTHLH